MLIVVSPAKTLDYETKLPTKKFSQPQLLNQSQELIDLMRTCTAGDLSALMNVSDKIAELNVERFAKWQQPFTAKNARAAMFAFKGDVYEGLQAYAMSAKDIDFAQKHLRILSGLYGLLRPLDLMQAYRLEMGTRLSNDKGKNLYAFWGNTITDLLNEDLTKQQEPALINLASNEYFKSVNKKALGARIITPQFRDWKNGEYKMISFFAKKARGMMSRYIIQERLVNPEDIKSFDVDGYSFNADLSGEDDWVFTRRQA